MWTQFNDAHSGGTTKEKFKTCYIEADEKEAISVFFARFGHNPHRVSCTCCGEDYSIYTGKSLKELSQFERGCAVWENPEDRLDQIYVEQGETPPDGWFEQKALSWGDYQTLEEYLGRDDVMVISASEIKDEERETVVKEQGYVWKD